MYYKTFYNCNYCHFTVKTPVLFQYFQARLEPTHEELLTVHFSWGRLLTLTANMTNTVNYGRNYSRKFFIEYSPVDYSIKSLTL
jgi:hypothetical protein